MENVQQTDNKDFMTYAKEAIGFSKLPIKIKKLDENAVIPSYAHDGDVGMDLTAISVEYDREYDMYIYHTGIAIETDKHYGVFLFPRSSNRKTDAYLCNHVGIADTAIYRGEIILCFKNRTSLSVLAMIEMNKEFLSLMGDNMSEFNPQKVKERVFSRRDDIMNNPMAFAPYKVGDRIAQMVVLPYPNVKINVVGDLTDTERGSNGFGSTGN